ncbi:MAG: TonB-dependent receptor domain-containing protein [Flavobacteriales bacterium]
MMRLFFVAVLFTATLSVLAQPGNRGGEGSIQGKLSGKVVSTIDDAAVEFATITVLSMRDSSIVTGAITGPGGRFSITDLRPGRFIVRISFIGFITWEQSGIGINPRDGLIKDLGTIRLEPNVQALEAAEVVEKKQFMELMMDKRVYNVGENLAVTGGSATDVLETLPSIEVDTDGAIQLRGSSNVNVLIDGKPSALAGDRQSILEQIPASSIERIEVITNPSARYDADGMTGIINIVLKKSKLSGFHGNVSATIATGDQYNGSISLNKRSGRLNLYSNYGYRYSDMFNRGYTDRTTFLDGPDLVLDQTQDGFGIRSSHNVKVGADVQVSDRSELAASGTVNFGSNLGEEQQLYFQNFSDGNELRNYERFSNENGENFGYDVNLGWRTIFDGRDHVWSADVQYGESDRTQFNSITNTDLLPSGEPVNGVTDREQNETPGYNDNLTLQTDYVRPLHNGEGKFETGYKTIVRTLTNGFFGEIFNGATQLFDPQVDRNNDFRFTEAVHAAYASYGRKINKFSFQGGLRAEQVYSESELITTGEVFNNDYFSLFPSAFLTYSLTEKSDVNISYSRRISRPGARQLNPFPTYTDELNLFQGNPFLLPEYINSFEAGYSVRQNKTFWIASVYAQDVTDVATRFSRVDTNGITTGTWENIARRQSYGLELVVNQELTDWWSVNLSGNAYRRDNNGGNIEAGLTNVAYSWSMRGMSTMKFKNGFNVQLSGFYRAPEQFVQGNFSGFWFTDIAVKKSLLKNKASLTVNLRDIFDTREFTFGLNDPRFVQERYRKRESRNLFVTFAYKFGKLDSKDKRSRSRGEGGDGGGFDSMDMD